MNEKYLNNYQLSFYKTISVWSIIIYIFIRGKFHVANEKQNYKHMKNRRNFLKKSLLLVSGITVSSSLLAGNNKKDLKRNSFSGIIYTKNDQGKWEGKSDSHVPEITINGNEVILFTDHPMGEFHYIVRHTLVDESGNVIGSKTFYPTDEKAKSTHEIPKGYKGKLYATSFCNKHDFWLKEFRV